MGGWHVASCVCECVITHACVGGWQAPGRNSGKCSTNIGADDNPSHAPHTLHCTALHCTAPHCTAPHIVQPVPVDGGARSHVCAVRHARWATTLIFFLMMIITIVVA